MNVRGSGKESLVQYHRQGHVGTITLNRPDKRNAMNPPLWSSLCDAIGAAEQDGEARVVLLRGEGKSFCAGLDLSLDNEMLDLIRETPSAAQKVRLYQEIRKIQDTYTRLERLVQPTMAIIQGHCLGAGLELALCCDIRFCSTGTVFSLPESTLGIITDVGGLQRLPRVVGRGHAREIAFRGHRFDAERALEINLVNHVYPDPETLYASAMEIANEIAGNPPLGTGAPAGPGDRFHR